MGEVLGVCKIGGMVAVIIDEWFVESERGKVRIHHCWAP